MNRRSFAVGLAGFMATACRQQADVPVAATKRSMKNDLVFLTRDGCVNTPDMSNNVDDALRALQFGLDCPTLNLASLAASDPRMGYPTPTVLIHGRDIFDMPEPTPPFPEPA